MSLRTTLSLLAGAGLLVSAGSAIAAAPKATLSSGVASKAHVALPAARTPEMTEALFRSDGSAELGLGCSNPTGNSGGPNDWAQKVTAVVITPPFGITSTTYNIFTNNLPNTVWDLVGWAGGATPGAEIFRANLTPADATAGNHTVTVVADHGVPTASFYFGFNDATPAHGMRLGMDSTSSAPGATFLRAPGCGAAAFTDVISIGFPGFWVIRAIADDTVPVELMDFNVR